MGRNTYTERVFPASKNIPTTVQNWAKANSFTAVVTTPNQVTYKYSGKRLKGQGLFLELAHSGDKMRIRAFCKVPLVTRLLFLFLIPEKRTLDSSGLLNTFNREYGATLLEPLFKTLSLRPIREKKNDYRFGLCFLALVLSVSSYLFSKITFAGAINSGFPPEMVDFNIQGVQYSTNGFLAFFTLLFALTYWWAAKNTSSWPAKASFFLVCVGLNALSGSSIYMGTSNIVPLHLIAYHCATNTQSDDCVKAQNNYRKFASVSPTPEQIIRSIKKVTARYPANQSARLIENLLAEKRAVSSVPEH